MKIAICEEDGQVLEQLLTYISHLRPKIDVSLSVSSFSSFSSFFSSLDQGNRYEIIFMNMDAGGIEVGYDLRVKYKDDLAILIYLTDRIDRKVYASKIMEVNCFAILQKPVQFEIFQEKMERACFLAMQIHGVERPELFTYKINRDTYQVEVKNIAYLKSDLREINLFLLSTDGEKIINASHYYGKLDEEQKKLPADNFFRVHQSYIVNLKVVRQIIHNKKLILMDGTEIPMSGAYQKKTAFQMNALLNNHTVDHNC